ncbi:MAG: HK97 family phage prohead protease [Propionivibrio sp.]|nr:HK97 family phage prohead protease [Propionivibrio sp.]
MLTHQTLSLSECDIKFAASEGTFSGYGSVFGNVDSYDDVIMAGAYSEVLKKVRIPVYVNHGWLDGKLPVGYWSGLNEDDRGLFGDASLVMKMPSAIDAYWGLNPDWSADYRSPSCLTQSIRSTGQTESE